MVACVYDCKVGGIKLLVCGRCKEIHYCFRACQVKHWPDHKLTCASLIKVDTSAIPSGGRGVFVTRDVSMSQYLCYYDGEVKINPTREESVYMIEETDDTKSGAYIGYANPRNAYGVGQLINDANRPNLSDFKSGCDIHWLFERARDYMIASTKAENVYYGSDKRFIACRNITSGSELYYSYGVDYWLTLSYWAKDTSDDMAYLITLFLAAHAMARDNLKTKLLTDEGMRISLQKLALNGSQTAGGKNGRVRQLEMVVLLSVIPLVSQISCITLEHVKKARELGKIVQLSFL